MCLAEALLRIPDAETADPLIKRQDRPRRMGEAARHLAQSLSSTPRTWALMLTGRMVSLDSEDTRTSAARSSASSPALGEPVIRQAVIAGHAHPRPQFVMGRNIDEALERARAAEKHGYRHSYDMLGEAARTAADALRYFDSYTRAIAAHRRGSRWRTRRSTAPSHLDQALGAASALRSGAARRVLPRTVAGVKTLAVQAKRAGIGFTIDAEETDRLELSLDLIEALALDPRPRRLGRPRPRRPGLSEARACR